MIPCLSWDEKEKRQIDSNSMPIFISLPRRFSKKARKQTFASSAHTHNQTDTGRIYRNRWWTQGEFSFLPRMIKFYHQTFNHCESFTGLPFTRTMGSNMERSFQPFSVFNPFKPVSFSLMKILPFTVCNRHHIACKREEKVMCEM